MGRLAQGGICRKRCKPRVIQRRQVQGKGQPTPSVCLLPPPTLKKLLKGCPGSGGVGEERKYLALFSLFAAILELLPEISSAPSPGRLQRGRSAEHRSAEPHRSAEMWWGWEEPPA